MASQVFKFDLRQLKQRKRELSMRQKRKTVEAGFEIAKLCEGAARDNAPIDKGPLSSDIVGNVQTDPATGVLAAVISVPVNATSKDYAIPMHEDDYNLGPKSTAKQAKLGNIVGKKYIERGIEDNKQEIREIIVKKLRV
jgi:hypothetical protein